MPQLAIAREFLTQYSKLEKRLQDAVEDAISKFQHHTYAGLHLEKVQHARDPHVRTVRIDKFWRGVVLAPDTGDTFCLLTVLPHDDAMAYCASRRFTVNQALGVLESRDELQLESMESALRKAADVEPRRLFEGVKDRELKRLGVDEHVLPLVRLLTHEAHLEAMQHLLPPAQYDALVALASGMTVEEAWAEVSKNLIEPAPPQQIDTDDLAVAMARTPERVAMIDGPEELTRILAHPFDVWRVFLHPVQRKIAYRDSYHGPAMVTGGAGTGKTVTALHRSAHLAHQQGGAGGGRILLTTYTRALAEALTRQLALLIEDDEVRQRVDVFTTDKVARAVVKEALGKDPSIRTDAEVRDRWDKAADRLRVPYTGTFLVNEWEQVILAQQLTSEEAYLKCERRGRGRQLGTAARKEVWRAIELLVTQMRQAGEWSFLQTADEAARLLRASGRTLYRHIVVDEGQDLHPAQWRLLRAAVPDTSDDLFLVADPHQRIYENRVSLASLGITVRGRSRRLTISYRTTQEILSWAVRVLDDELPVDGLDDIPDTLTGYGSPMHGRRPTVRRFPDREAELDGLVAQVSAWLASGVEPSAIGVAARRNNLANQALHRLNQSGIKAMAPSVKSHAVQVSSMHTMKGLEFRCVAVIGADEGLVPLPVALIPETEDPVAHKHALQRERCLLFVACTRARDSLYVSHSGQPSPFLPRSVGKRQ